MKVSIIMLTYNHEKFIAQAVKSALFQLTDFDYEIVIGDDCSTDRTQEIIRELAIKNPEKIRPILRQKNLGASKNFLSVLASCQGEYIAMLEGDDYWISPDKLQKQVDMLDANPELAISFHNIICFYEDGSKQPWEYCQRNQKPISTLEDLLHGNFIPTCSVMFRNGLIKDFPEWYLTTLMGDWPLHIMNAEHGKIGYINEIMANYRIHTAGMWTSLSRIRQCEVDIDMYVKVNDHFKGKYSKIILPNIESRQAEISKLKSADPNSKTTLQPRSIVNSAPKSVLRASSSFKFAFFAGDNNNFKYINEFTSLLRLDGCEVRVIESTDLSLQTLHEQMKWSDVSWFEWANGPVIPASRMPKVCKMICRLHNTEVFSPAPSQINWQNIDHLIFVSKSIRALFEQLLQGNIDQNTQVHVIPYGIDLREFNMIERGCEKRIAYLSDFHSEMNPALMPLILNQIVKNDPSYHLFMAGRIRDLTLHRYIIDVIKKLKIEQNFTYDGQVENMIEWLSDKDFILSTSIVENNHFEIIEGMALGLKPIIHNYLGNQGESFDTKYIFDTPEEAAQLILSDDHQPIEYRNFVEERFNLDSEINQFKQIVFDSAPIAGTIDEIDPTPHITVVLFANRESALFEQSLHSVLSQNYPFFDVFLVDQSGDAYVLDNRVQSVTEDAFDTIFRSGTSEVKGEFLVWLDRDSVLLPHAIDNLVKAHSIIPTADVLYGDSMLVDENMRVKSAKRYEDWYNRERLLVAKLRSGDCLPSSGLMIRRRRLSELKRGEDTGTFQFDHKFWAQNIGSLKIKHIGFPICKILNDKPGSESNQLDTASRVRVLKILLGAHSLMDVFPEIQWKTLPEKEAKASALLLAAEQFLQSNDVTAALEVIARSYELVPSEDTNTLMQKLKKLKQAKRDDFLPQNVFTMKHRC